VFSRKINMILRFKDSRNDMVVRHLVLESNMFARSQALESGKATIPHALRSGMIVKSQHLLECYGFDKNTKTILNGLGRECHI
jgi:hypothetical protein